MFTLEQVKQLQGAERRFYALGQQLSTLKQDYESADRGKKGVIKRQINLLESECNELGQVVFHGDVPQPESPEKALPQLVEWIEKIKVEYEQLRQEVSEGVLKNAQYTISWKVESLLKAEYKWLEVRDLYQHLAEIADPYEKVTEYIRIYNELMERWQEALIDNARGATRSNLIDKCIQEAVAELVYHFKGRWGRYDRRQERLCQAVEVWKVVKDNGLLEPAEVRQLKPVEV